MSDLTDTELAAIKAAAEAHRFGGQFYSGTSETVLRLVAEVENRGDLLDKMCKGTSLDNGGWRRVLEMNRD